MIGRNTRIKHDETTREKRLCLGQLAQPTNSTMQRTVIRHGKAGETFVDTPPDCRSSGRGDGPSTASNGLCTSPALPDADGLTLDGILVVDSYNELSGVTSSHETCLSTEGASVPRMLRNFHLFQEESSQYHTNVCKCIRTHLLHLLTERGTVTL